MKNPYYAGPESDHFDGTRFFNPDHPSTDRSFTDLLRWRFAEPKAKWPAHVPVTPVRPDARVAECRATMVGHASVLIQVSGLNILTDPVWSERVSPFSFAGPKRVTVPGIAFDDLPPIDVVLLSHNHYDHLDKATLRRLDDRFHPRVVTALGNDRLLREFVPSIDVTAGDWGETIALGRGHNVTLTPAHHWSARGIGDRRMALWCGFYLKIDDIGIYFAGDTGYGDGAIFRALHQTHGAPDLALLPIGAYAPRWFMEAQHMNPEDAVCVLEAFHVKQAMGIHWGTFQLTDEAREEPAERLVDAMRSKGIDPARFRAARPGDVFEVSR